MAKATAPRVRRRERKNITAGVAHVNATFRYSDTTHLVVDRDERPVLLFRAPWAIDLVRKNHPDLQLTETAAALQ